MLCCTAALTASGSTGGRTRRTAGWGLPGARGDDAHVSEAGPPHLRDWATRPGFLFASNVGAVVPRALGVEQCTSVLLACGHCTATRLVWMWASCMIGAVAVQVRFMASKAMQEAAGWCICRGMRRRHNGGAVLSQRRLLPVVVDSAHRALL